MTYYILLEGDSKNAIWDENILGEESFGTFYTGDGFRALNTIVMSDSHLIDTVTIIDEKKTSYSVEDFVKLISKFEFNQKSLFHSSSELDEGRIEPLNEKSASQVF